MSDSTANIPQIESSQASKEVTANANFAAASPSIIFGRNQVTSTALTWGYIGGRWGGTSVANGTLSLTGSTTNYVVADRTTGAVTVSTATTNWNSATTYGRLYSIVTGSSSVTSYQDHRAGPNGIFVGSASGVGSGTVTNTGGNLTSNAVVLGAGTADTKVVAGITTDGTSAINLGVAGTSVGKLVLANATSGSITLQPTTGALGTVTLTAPATTGTLALTSQVTGTNSGTNTGDQNLFSTIAVSGQSNVVADTTSDTLTIVAGTNITITTDAGADSITIAASTGGFSDGDKGDITVSGTGATFTIDNDVVTYAKMQNVSATSRIIGRKTSGSGDPEECTLSEVLDFVGSAAQGDILYRGSSAWTRLGAGTSGYFLKTQGTGADPTWSTVSGASLANFTETLATSSPNVTINVASLAASGAASSIDIVIEPKLNGGLMAQTPDSSTTGGNKRGQLAVDFQRTRSSASQVASGTRSVIVNGTGNTSSGTDSFVGAGASVAATANYAVAVGGTTNTASGAQSSLLGGSTNVASGAYSASLGGANCIASGGYSIACGAFSSTLGLLGAFSNSSGAFSATGDSQRMDLVLRVGTTNATTKRLTSDANNAAADNQLILSNNSSYVVTGLVVVRENATGDTASWKFDAHIRRGANAAATAMVAACTPTQIAADAGASTWTIAVAADTTNGGLAIDVTGEASHTLRWVATLTSAQVVL